MKVSMSTIAFLIFILMLSIFVAKVTNLIATDVETNLETIKPKYYDIDDSPDHLMWFLQISDIHISVFKDYSRITEFKEFCDITVRTIKPAVVLASGDLTDAKTKDAMGSKQILDEWEHYKRVLKETDVTKRTTWLDVRGNHDNFNVIALNSSENYYTNYSVQGRNHSRSYIHQISANKEKFSFIAIDACLEPGPRRPFNFIGLLDNKEVDHVRKLAQESRRLNSHYIIWFGHYPTSSILTEDTRSIRNIMGDYGEGLVYLCGHYHTLGGTLPEMYTLQHAGFLELELGDWKDNRLYRVAAVDHGQFSFIDVKHGDWPVILITNPKHALYTMPSKENLESIIKSTHIRVLAFSTAPIEKVEIKINDEPWINCNHIEGPLYTVKWNPALYNSGIQIICARVEDKDGPWAIGEIIDDHVGVIFAWGMFIKNAYLPGSFTYAYGFFQLLSFHMPLTILLAHRIDKRFDEFDRPIRKSSSIFSIFWANLPFLLLIMMQTSMTYFFWLAYGTLATILCPLRTWSIILALVVWYQVYTLPNHCLKSAKYIWSTSKESTINNK
ncbi:hypothetical protein G9C98_001433 [Cotesia typhae]|uniref:Transmembrane protein 62 n=1 Tax=Cotesia typhae TaxID=2053667 RepID=A0A8J5UQE6_9HYME|nr:hypothetical protein G9C98_001433 [Cotesia typhae]